MYRQSQSEFESYCERTIVHVYNKLYDLCFALAANFYTILMGRATRRFTPTRI